MADLVSGAVVGAVFGELLKAVLDAAKLAVNFKSIFDDLRGTLLAIEPLFLEIDRLNNLLDCPKQEKAQFLDVLDKGLILVKKCQNVSCFNLYKKRSYSKKLLKFKEELLAFCHVDLQIQQSRDSKELRVGIDRIFTVLTSNGSVIGSSDRSFSGSCGVPGLPEFVVGLDVPLQELKLMLLQDKASAVLLSAPGGCGKTTLAKKLCHDKEIQDIYRDNIFFVTVSKTPNLEVIAQKIFQMRGYPQPPEFQSDEDTFNQLELLLRKTEPSPVLLILDDVWSGSESLIDNFMFNIQEYKILVTSRSMFPRFDHTYPMKLLDYEDAITLFSHLAFPQNKKYDVSEDLVKDVVNGCGGFPLAIEVVAQSLRGQPPIVWKDTLKKWSQGRSIFGSDSNDKLVLRLQTSIDALEGNGVLKDCYLDLGSFPEDQRIAANALMDMWVELYDLEEDGTDTFLNLHELSIRTLVNLLLTKKDESDVDACDGQFVTQHDLLRELAIHLSSQEQIEQRTRLILDIAGDKIPKWWTEQEQMPVNARLVSITTDGTFSSSWYDMQLPKAEALILNFRTKDYNLPQFLDSMNKLKVLIVTNYGFFPAQLNNYELLGCLSSLKRIRFENVSLPFIGTSLLLLKNLLKMSLVMCDIGKAFENCNNIMDVGHVLPNLVEIEIDCCDDLEEFPEILCSIVRLKKLSITYCHELSSLSVGFGKMTNLEVLRLHTCTKLPELPDSIENLKKLNFLDISDCLSLSTLPERIGDLCSLRTLHMRGCEGLYALPPSVKYLELKDVICDEEIAYLWELYSTSLPKLRVKVLHKDINLNWLDIFHP